MSSDTSLTSLQQDRDPKNLYPEEARKIMLQILRSRQFTKV